MTEISAKRTMKMSQTIMAVAAPLDWVAFTKICTMFQVSRCLFLSSFLFSPSSFPFAFVYIATGLLYVRTKWVAGWRGEHLAKIHGSHRKAQCDDGHPGHGPIHNACPHHAQGDGPTGIADLLGNVDGRIGPHQRQDGRR